MRISHYRVGGHLFQVQYKDEGADDSLIPSFRPFTIHDIPANENPVFVLTVDETADVHAERIEVGQFDGSGNNYGVYKFPDGGYMIEMSNPMQVLCGILYADKEFRQCRVRLLAADANNRNFALNNALMMAYAFATANMQTLLLHASVIRKDGYGYLMTAPSGTGKSTHTYLWYKNIPGCDLMNDDNPVVRIVDGTPVVYSTPWSGKTPCYRNIEAPVGAIVRIQQRKKNEIHRMAPVESLAQLLPAASSMKWDERVYLGVCDTLSVLISKVGIYELGCLPDADAARLCYGTIKAKD